MDRLAQVSSHLNFPRGLFAGQTAIITGAGQGIGAEAARLFANEGAKVVVADIDEREFSFFSYFFKEGEKNLIIL
jgi:3-oxoacyl-[acyl-carrier protein] reductase